MSKPNCINSFCGGCYWIAPPPTVCLRLSANARPTPTAPSESKTPFSVGKKTIARNHRGAQKIKPNGLYQVGKSVYTLLIM
jgi:hypothetical protein